MHDALQSLIHAFLDLIERGSDSVQENEKQLSLLCDQLACAIPRSEPEFDPTDYGDPPARNYEQARQLVAQRFPNYGYYNTPVETTTHLGETALAVGDAIDDIADIAGDLGLVLWRLDNTSEADALWHLWHDYENHWGRHLRRLQLYQYCFHHEL